MSSENNAKKPILNPRIKTWKPKEEDILVSSDGKVFLVFFDKIYQIDRYKEYNIFQIKKGSYENKMTIICRYINYFEHFYDQDHELIDSYLKLKFALEHQRCFTTENMEAFIDFLYEIMFKPSMIKKIETLVEENYLDDIEAATEEKKQYIKSEQDHLESLRFTNQHIRILLAISMGMKVMSPVMYHYFAFNNIKINKNDKTIFRFYKRLFDIFGQDCDIYNKLYVYVKTKVLECYANNQLMFSQREIFGDDLYTKVDSFLKVILISDNMVKYQFSENWDPKTHHYKENVPGFNKTVIKFQLHYFLKDQHALTLTEIANVKNSDGLSGSDKMQMNLSKIDESIPIQSDINVKYELERIQSMIDIDVPESDIEYYRKYQSPSKIQIQLIYSYYAKFFGSYTDLNLLTAHNYALLAALLKKKLLLELGYDEKTKSPVPAALPYILTGNIIDKVNTRVIRNSKFIEKITGSYLWQKLANDKYAYLNEIEPDFLTSMLSTLINTEFSFVTPEFPELLGKKIMYSDDKVCDELLFFLNSI